MNNVTGLNHNSQKKLPKNQRVHPNKTQAKGGKKATGVIQSSHKSTSHNFNRNYKLRQTFFLPLFRFFWLETGYSLLMWALFSFTQGTALRESSFFNITFLVLQVVNITMILLLFVDWYIHYYVVSPNAVLKSWGIFFRRTTTCDMPSIRAVHVRQTLFQRVFNYGNLELESPLLENNFFIKKVQKPYKHAKLIDLQRLKQLEDSDLGNITPVI